MKEIIQEETFSLTQLNVKIIKEKMPDSSYSYMVSINDMLFKVHDSDSAYAIFDAQRTANNILELAVL